MNLVTQASIKIKEFADESLIETCNSIIKSTRTFDEKKVQLECVIPFDRRSCEYNLMFTFFSLLAADDKNTKNFYQFLLKTDMDIIS